MVSSCDDQGYMLWHDAEARGARVWQTKDGHCSEDGSSKAPMPRHPLSSRQTAPAHAGPHPGSTCTGLVEYSARNRGRGERRSDAGARRFFIVRNTPAGVGLLREWYNVPEVHASHRVCNFGLQKHCFV